MEQHFGKVTSAYHLSFTPRDGANLVKVHDHHSKLAKKADYIFTSIRDRKGMIDSIKRVNKLGDNNVSPDNLDGVYQGWIWWAEKAHFIQSYYETHDLPKLIRRYIDFLGWDLDPAKVKEQLDREMVAPGEDTLNHDPKTLLHAKHRKSW